MKVKWIALVWQKLFGKSPVQLSVSEQMRRTSLALTLEQRRENGRKAWQTRLANIQKRIDKGEL